MSALSKWTNSNNYKKCTNDNNYNNYSKYETTNTQRSVLAYELWSYEHNITSSNEQTTNEQTKNKIKEQMNRSIEHWNKSQTVKRMNIQNMSLLRRAY